MDTSKNIKGIILAIIFAFVAVWVGVSLVTSQTETVLQVAGVALFAVCVLLGRRIWLLMMLFIAFNIPLIRGFSTPELGQALFLGFSVLQLMIRRMPTRGGFGEPEFWFLALGATVLQVFIRNPVGLDIMGAGSVGAKPYFVVTLAFLSAFFLSILQVSPGDLRWAARLTIIGTYIGIPLSEFRVRTSLESRGESTEQTRVPWLSHTSTATLQWLVAHTSPYKVFLRPLLMLAFLLCVIAAAGSGYRNSIAMAGLYLLVGVYYHHGFFPVFLSTIAAGFVIGILAVVNTVTPLPAPMQRALSPFPGTWEERYIRDAEASTEWRVEMWKEALLTDYWIQNKWLGDGLGFTKAELEHMKNEMTAGKENYRGTSGLTIQQENMMISGGYHSGPVHTIRTVGYVGLAVLLLAMTRLAVFAHRQIRRCQNTEWAFVARFFGIPLIVLPIFFTLIFGDFGRDLVVVIMGFGIMRLFERNVPVPQIARVSRRAASIPPPSHRNTAVRDVSVHS